MKLLLIDAGNARLKWAIRDNGDIGPAQFADLDQHPEQAISVLRATLESVDAIAVSNVAGSEFERQLDKALRSMPTKVLWYARTSSHACGVRNAYAQPELLGVDRWAALIGAYTRARANGKTMPLCVVDAGTALTIDAVRPNGEHIGGLILPGIDMQRSMLLGSTADLAEKARAANHRQLNESVFATDTATAINESAAIACAATIDRCVAEVSSEYGAPLLLVTGGDAGEISGWLATGCEICPNLVFEGLAILFDQSGSG